MARIRTLKPEFFQDEKLAELSPYSRLLAVAILQLCDVSGRMRWIPMQVHAHAFPFEPDVDIEALAEDLESIEYLIRYEINGRLYAEIPGFIRHQRVTGKEAQTPSQIPPPDSRGNNRETPGCFPEKHLDVQERERERERGTGKGRGVGKENQNPKPKNGTKRFSKPTMQEISVYCQERKNNIDPQQFFDFYESKGWKVGSTPMKDWQAAVRTWEAKRKDSGEQQPKRAPRPML